MKIAIDARWIFPRISGIGRVTEKLIQYLGKIDPENHYLLLFDHPELLRQYARQWEEYPRLETALVPWRLFSPFDQWGLPSWLRKNGVDLFHSPNYLYPLLMNSPPVVVTIHDLIPLKFPEFTPRAKKTRFNFIFRLILRRSVHRASRVIAVSRHTRDDLISLLGLEEEKIRVVYNGVDRTYRRLEAGKVQALLAEKFQITAPYFLFVGRFDPYKNVTGLIRALADFSGPEDNPLHLVIAGSPDPRYPEAGKLVKSLGVSDRVHFLEKVDEEELLYLYNGALALVLPSLYEGFGLPPLEAMACGTPVICSNRGSLPEVVGEAALLVEPEVDEIAAGLERIWKDEQLRAELRRRGLQRAASFSWEKTAAETLNVYKEV